MARRTFVHIGLPKTGTTYLQTKMWQNRPHLRRQGFLYPGNKRMDHYHAQQVLRGAPAQRLRGNAGSWDLIRDALTSWEGDGILTHEFLCLAEPAHVERVVTELQPTEVHVVVTVRDLVRQFPALWQEALKMNYDGSFDEFVADALEGRRPGAWGMNSQDLPAILERWTAVVAPANVHVVTTPPPDAPRHLLWTRWCQVLGIDDADFEEETGRANESLGAAQAALLHHVKPFLTGALNEGPVRHRWVRAYFGHEVLVPQRGERFGVRPDQVPRLREHSLAAAEYLRGHHVDVVGDVEELVPPETPPAAPHPDDVTLEAQLDVAARAIDQMINDVRDLTLRNEALQKRARRGDRPGRRRAAARLWGRVSRR